MRCLSTRTTREGFKRRRYVSAAGHRFTTIEVPLELWERINSVGRQRDRVAQAARALARESKQRQARALSAAGRSASDIAAALEVSRRTVQRWVRG